MEDQLYISQEDLEETAAVLSTSVLLPLSETMERIRRAWQDPAGAAYSSRLSAHIESIEEVRRTLAEAARDAGAAEGEDQWHQ